MPLNAADRLRSALREQAPHLLDRLVELGEGWDHRVYRAGDVAVRVQKEMDDDGAELIEREAAVLRAVATVTPLAVPEPLVVDAERGVMVYRFVEGEPLADLPAAAARAFASELLAFVHAVASIPNDTLRLPRSEVSLGDIHREAVETLPRVAHALTAAQRRSIERFLGEALPAEPVGSCVCHHDLGAEHVLVTADGRSLAGVIDWTDAVYADPVYDLGLLVRDVGIELFDDFGIDDVERQRALFYARCAAIEDLAYGLDRAEPRYVTGALRSLTWLC